MRKSKYSEEFKKVSVQRVLDGESQKIVAADLGINAKTLNQWVNRQKAQMSPSDLNQLNETETLRRQVRQLKAELEFLKKSLEPSWLSSRIKIIKFHAVQFLLSARREPHRKSYPLFRSAHLN